MVAGVSRTSDCRNNDNGFPNTLSDDKRFIIYRLRECPACKKHSARVERKDRDGQPILRCRDCGRTFPCVYGKE